MRVARHLALCAYCAATWPARWAAAGLDRLRASAPLAILFYHRVADHAPSPWTLPTREFQRHLDWLERRFEIISLDECRRRIAGGSNRRTAVSITFDDGYADNCRFALPLLVERGIPCTYFVTARNVLEQQPFPHDAHADPPAPNTIDQLRHLAECGIEIGAHTRTHADLGQIHDEATLYDELVAAGHDLARELGTRVRYFAFPYGLPRNLNRRAFDMARDAGYEAVCSAYGGYNFPGDDAFHLQRIHADDDFAALRNWLTVDPRKRFVPRYVWTGATGAPPSRDLPDTVSTEQHQAASHHG